ncbi:MAG: hypothetical protein KBT29_09395 [Prevotellaceae bacterium]|nr:hypothetical protein [Candidatus Minthosoma caballi]
MKKYIKPECEVLMLETENMLEASGQLQKTSDKASNSFEILSKDRDGYDDSESLW